MLRTFIKMFLIALIVIPLAILVGLINGVRK